MSGVRTHDSEMRRDRALAAAAFATTSDDDYDAPFSVVTRKTPFRYRINIVTNLLRFLFDIDSIPSMRLKHTCAARDDATRNRSPVKILCNIASISKRYVYTILIMSL